MEGMLQAWNDRIAHESRQLVTSLTSSRTTLENVLEALGKIDNGHDLEVRKAAELDAVIMASKTRNKDLMSGLDALTAFAEN